MKSKKIILDTFNRKTDDGEGINSTSTCSQCKMNFRFSTKLLIVMLVMLAYSLPPTRGTGLPSPFGAMERTPARENCTGQACEKQRAQVQRMKNHRLATIKQTIFEKLGFDAKPNVTKEIPKVVIDKAVKKVLERSNPKSEPAFPGGYFAEVSEIVSFAEEVLGK